MKRALFLTSALFLAGCTYNQQKHAEILLSPTYKNYSPTQDAWIVEQSLANRSEEFSLSLIQSEKALPCLFLKGDNLPANERFIFANLDPTNGKIEVSFEFELMADGKVQVFEKNTTRIEDDIPFIAGANLIAAKPVLYTIVSKKTFTSATAEFVPHPIESEGQDGRISLVATHPLLTRFELRAEEFSPGEKIKLTHRSADRIEEIEVQAKEDGTFSLPLNPTVFGKLGGEASLTIEHSGKTFSLNYPWGAQLEKKTFESRTQFPILFVINQSIDEIDSTRIESEFASLL